MLELKVLCFDFPYVTRGSFPVPLTPALSLFPSPFHKVLVYLLVLNQKCQKLHFVPSIGRQNPFLLSQGRGGRMGAQAELLVVTASQVQRRPCHRGCCKTGPTSTRRCLHPRKQPACDSGHPDVWSCVEWPAATLACPLLVQRVRREQAHSRTGFQADLGCVWAATGGCCPHLDFMST